MSQRAAIILAAGQGTRMRSDLPKVLHAVGSRPMVDWSIALAQAAGCTRIVVVSSPTNAGLNHHVETVLGKASLAIQSPALGTGHAVQAAEGALAGFVGDVVVLYGDTPLIPLRAVEEAFATLAAGAAVSVLGFEAAVPGGYGRLVKSASGALERIVEAKDATAEELAIRTCNSGVMAARCDTLFALLKRVTNHNAKGEYYLTDVVGLANGDGHRVAAVSCEEADVLGVNSRAELAAAELAFQRRMRQAMMESGVTLIAPETVYFAHDTQIGRDTIVEPHVVFGPGVQIAENCRIRGFSHIEGAHIAQGCEVGPYARLRPGTVLGPRAKIGNFVETKKVSLGAGAKANHLSYLGDGEVGEDANIGAGTIFCNYDGFDKHQTIIGAGAFIGSNSALVAPVRIGEGAMVGSGSVITDDVPDHALALARGTQSIRPDWALRFREAKRARRKPPAGSAS
jgi:bifunctional UDP-N-acetylglucosamine pyrophosphorylase/glucosamine-1-phosphate N-acetyltransferase